MNRADEHPSNGTTDDHLHIIARHVADNLSDPMWKSLERDYGWMLEEGGEVARIKGVNS